MRKLELQQRLNVKSLPYYVKLYTHYNETGWKWQAHMLSSRRTGAADPYADLLTIFKDRKMSVCAYL